jgi:hypothetical protein
MIFLQPVVDPARKASTTMFRSGILENPRGNAGGPNRYRMEEGGGHFFPSQLMTSENHGAPLTYLFLGFTDRINVEH